MCMSIIMQCVQAPRKNHVLACVQRRISTGLCTRPRILRLATCMSINIIINQVSQFPAQLACSTLPWQCHSILCVTIRHSSLSLCHPLSVCIRHSSVSLCHSSVSLCVTLLCHCFRCHCGRRHCPLAYRCRHARATWGCSCRAKHHRTAARGACRSCR